MKNWLCSLLWVWIMAIALVSPASAGERVSIGGVPLDVSLEENGVTWKAFWIQDPLFRAQPYYHWLHKDKDTVEVRQRETEPANVHTLFRRTFQVGDQAIRQAKLFITADDVYKLYLNETFVGLGPAPGYLFAYPYNGWDVTESLQPGKVNCLAVHVYYQGLLNRVWGSADNLQGLLAQLEITYQNGQTETLISDGNWKYHRSEINSATRTFGYKTQFAEDLDLNQAVPEWKSPSYDDHPWQTPYVAAYPCPTLYTLVPQWTPPLEFEKVWPEKILQTGEGRYFIDFGTELTGTTCLVVSGAKDQVVEIRHGEELVAENEVRFKMRAGCLYQEFCTLSGRAKETIEFFDYKGFRYVEVLNWPEELKRENIWVLNRFYPFPQEACAFESSDDLLNRIWDICRRGTQLGTQDTYLDCPTREKGGYLGDAYVTGQSHVYLTGDSRILRKALQDFAHSARICPGLMGVAPGNFVQEIADYSLLWPVLLERYSQWSGDRDFVRSMIPVMEGLLHYFARYENGDGLLENLQEKWNLIDWPQNLRDNYDYDRAAKGINTVLNHFYYGCLNSCANLYQYAGLSKEAQRIKQKAEKLQAICRKVLVNPETGLFVDAAGSTHSALHGNALSLMFGLLPHEGEKAIIGYLANKRIQCGVYFASFLLEGLYRAGQGQLAYDLITSKDEHSWNTMLEAGATTCMEAWGPDQKWNTSWCHPWSSCPIYLIAGELMGLKPLSPGWEIIDFSPQPPTNLEQAKIAIPTPKGTIATSFHQDNDRIVYQLTVPDNCSAQITLIDISPTVIVDGLAYECEASPTSSLTTTRILPVKLEAGEHTIEANRLQNK